MTTTTGIRLAGAADLPALTAIYNHYVTRTGVTFDVDPYTVEERRRSWFDDFAADGPYRLFVAERSGEVLGWASTRPYRPKAAYRTSVESSVYLDPTAVGRGLGSSLYRALFDALRSEPIHRVLAGIALPNPASLALHRRFGFSDVGTFREVGFKLGRYWDVHWMEKPQGAGCEASVRAV